MDPCRTKVRHLGKVIKGVSLVGGSFKRKHYYLVKMLVTQVCPTFCDPMDRAMGFSRASSRPRDQPQVSCTASRFFTNWATREVPLSEKKDFDTSLFRLPGATQDGTKILKQSASNFLLPYQKFDLTPVLLYKYVNLFTY